MVADRTIRWKFVQDSIFFRPYKAGASEREREERGKVSIEGEGFSDLQWMNSSTQLRKKSVKRDKIEMLGFLSTGLTDSAHLKPAPRSHHPSESNPRKITRTRAAHKKMAMAAAAAKCRRKSTTILLPRGLEADDAL